MPSGVAQQIPTVATTPVQALDGSQPAALVRNLSLTNTINLGGTPDSLTGTSVVPLPPGGSFMWPDATTLFAQAIGGPATLLVVPGGEPAPASAQEVAAALLSSGVPIVGPVTVTGSVTTTGTTSIAGSVTVTGGSLTVAGVVSVSGTTTIAGAVTVTSGTVSISGTTAISGAVTISSGTVTISGPVSISGTVTVAGAVTVTSGTVSISGTTTISGAVTITSGTVSISGPVSISGTVTVAGAVTITSGSVTVSSITAGTIDLTATTQNGVAVQIQNLGTPSINQETRLAAQTNIPAGGGVVGVAYDMTKLNLFALFVRNQSSGNLTANINFYSAASVAAPNTNELIYTRSITLAQNATGYIAVPVVGNCIQVVWDVATAGAFFRASGSTRPIPGPIEHISDGSGTAGWTGTSIANGNDAIYGFAGTLANGVTASFFPSFKPGPITISLITGGTSTVTISDLDGYTLATGNMVSGVALVFNLIGPRKGIKVAVTNNSGGSRNYTTSTISQST